MSKPVTFQRAFLKPKYWGVWAGLLFLRLLVFLPYKTQLAIGRLLGRLTMRFSPYRRHIVEVNLRLCFPELSPNARNKLMQKNFLDIGMGTMEMAMAWWMSKRRIRKIKVDYVNQDIMDAAIDSGKGVVFISGHFTCLELAGRLHGRDYKVNGLYRRHKNPVFNYVMVKRRSHYAELIERRDFRAFLRSLRRNIPVWYASDQDYGAKHSVFAPFFGVPAATVTALSKLQRIHKPIVLLGGYYRKPDYSGYDFVLTPMPESFPSGDEKADAILMNRFLEDSIRRSPEQYLWQHRRFKTRPKGEARPYKKKREF